MKKIILSLFVLVSLALLASSVALAETATTNANTKGSLQLKVKSVTKVNTSCVGAAVGMREDAIMSAWSKFDDAVTAVLAARKSALVTAWGLTDAKERAKTVRVAWATAKKDRRASASLYKKERKAAWEAFKTTVKACNNDAAASEASKKTDTKETVEL